MNKQEITSKIKEITETGAVCGVDVYVCLKGEEQGFYICYSTDRTRRRTEACKIL